MDWDELDPAVAEELSIVRKSSSKVRVDSIYSFANITHPEHSVGRFDIYSFPMRARESIIGVTGPDIPEAPKNHS